MDLLCLGRRLGTADYLWSKVQACFSMCVSIALPGALLRDTICLMMLFFAFGQLMGFMLFHELFDKHDSRDTLMVQINVGKAIKVFSVYG